MVVTSGSQPLIVSSRTPGAPSTADGPLTKVVAAGAAAPTSRGSVPAVGEDD